MNDGDDNKMHQALAIQERAEFLAQLTPESLSLQVANEAGLRKVLTSYVQSQLQEGHHYYYLNDQQKADGLKPALAKDGALNISSLFKVTPMAEDPHITFEEGGHMTVRFRVNIVNAAGSILARGEGMASTRETKYASQRRWLTEKKLPEGIDKETLKSEQRESKYGPYKAYLLETTSNPADHYNTVLKMAEKRALVGAASKLPLVSELFTQDLEPGEDATREYVAAQESTRRPSPKNVTPKPKNANGNGGKKESPTPGLDELINELRTYGVSFEEIQERMKSLVGVTKRAELNEGQVVTCIENFEAWLSLLDARQKGEVIDADPV